MVDNMQRTEGPCVYWCQSKLIKQDKFWAENDNGSWWHLVMTLILEMLLLMVE